MDTPILLFLLFFIPFFIAGLFLHIKEYRWKYKSNIMIKNIIEKELANEAKYIVNIYEPDNKDYNPLKKTEHIFILGGLTMVGEKTYYRIVKYKKDEEFKKKWFRFDYNVFNRIKYEIADFEK